MIGQRWTSRNVVLTAAFLALAAGGTAACDVSPTDEDDPSDSTYIAGPGDYYSGGGSGDSLSGDSSSGGSSSGDSSSGDVDDAVGDYSGDDEVFYCADENGEIVDEDYCDDDNSTYYLWHSSGYARGLRPGSSLDGGDYFPAGDRKARGLYHLPKTGRVGNGTVKTNVVGQRSTGSSGGESAGG